jgi:protein SCO1
VFNNWPFLLMKKTQKIVIMILVLLSPVLVLLFLKQFGSNKFDLPVYYQEGNPLTGCNDSAGPHKLTSAYISNNIIELPALFVVPGKDKNEYISDLDNVLIKYPNVKTYKVLEGENMPEEEGIFTLRYNSASFLKFVNCQLVLGEDQWLAKAIPYKYVLVDEDALIRGYFICNQLDEIERLDIELDILLNY